MSEKTPAQQYNELYKKARQARAQIQDIRDQIAPYEKEIDECERAAHDLVVKLVQVEEGDLVVDDMGVIYRVDRVQYPSIQFDNRYAKAPKKVNFTDLINRVSFAGVALHKNGVPRWTDARRIRGKVKKYEPEAS